MFTKSLAESITAIRPIDGVTVKPGVILQRKKSLPPVKDAQKIFAKVLIQGGIYA